MFAPRPTSDPRSHVVVKPSVRPAPLYEDVVQAEAEAVAPVVPPSRFRDAHLRQIGRTMGRRGVWPDLFDRAADPDVPEMPTLLACALDRLGQFVAAQGLGAPGPITNTQAVEALSVICAHFRPTPGEVR